MNDAKVACRQLKTVGYWQWGQGSGKVWLDKMHCSGSESSLGSCTSNGWGSGVWCSGEHFHDVSVVYSGYPGIQRRLYSKISQSLVFVNIMYFRKRSKTPVF